MLHCTPLHPRQIIFLKHLHISLQTPTCTNHSVWSFTCLWAPVGYDSMASFVGSGLTVALQFLTTKHSQGVKCTDVYSYRQPAEKLTFTKPNINKEGLFFFLLWNLILSLNKVLIFFFIWTVIQISNIKFKYSPPRGICCHSGDRPEALSLHWRNSHSGKCGIASV